MRTPGLCWVRERLLSLSVWLALTRIHFRLPSLYEVGSRDPLSFVAVTLVLIAVALMATLIPARSAARVDPMVALRCE
jgi:ABC-type lipoprotein release transport system permease subunit